MQKCREAFSLTYHVEVSIRITTTIAIVIFNRYLELHFEIKIPLNIKLTIIIISSTVIRDYRKFVEHCNHFTCTDREVSKEGKHIPLPEK